LKTEIGEGVLGEGQRAPSYQVWGMGSTVSSPSGVRGRAGEFIGSKAGLWGEASEATALGLVPKGASRLCRQKRKRPSLIDVSIFACISVRLTWVQGPMSVC